MKSIRNFFSRHRQHFNTIGLCLVAFGLTLCVTGCAAPTWLTDAQSIIGQVGVSIATIGSFIASLTGNAALAAVLAEVSTWITEVENGITDLESLISQYTSTPNSTLLTQIEAALTDVQTNLQKDFSNLGIPASILAVIAGIAALALSQLEAWGSLIPGLKAADTLEAKLSFLHSQPKAPGLTAAEYQAEVVRILSTPQDDPTAESALAKVRSDYQAKVAA
jgi:hypothetical protein